MLTAISMCAAMLQMKSGASILPAAKNCSPGIPGRFILAVRRTWHLAARTLTNFILPTWRGPRSRVPGWTAKASRWPIKNSCNMKRLKDKIAIVTGGAHGIGQAIAVMFAREGARVFIADLDVKAGGQTAADIRSTGGQATFVQCDVSKAIQVKRVVKRAMGQGSIDVLCNNA